MPDGPARDDKAKTSMTRSVLSNWVGHFVFMAVGFILPRLVSDQIGAEALGLWDLGWSLVNYTALLSLDIVGAVTRYVARYRATADWRGLSEAVSSSLALLCGSCALGVIATGVFVFFVPSFIPQDCTITLVEARHMVGVLGVGAALQLPLNVFNGVISGCERFDLKNAIRVSVRIAELVAMASLLLLGHGLVSLAYTILTGVVLRGLLAYVVARCLCRQLRITPLNVSWTGFRLVLSFGGKSALAALSRSCLYQTNGLILAYYVGPVALAVYARQRALVLHAIHFLNQYAHVLIPVSSTMHAKGKEDDLRRLLTKSARYGLYFALPVVAALAIVGGALVHIWMGPDYEAPLVLAILVLGHLVSLSQRPAFCILVGMHKHALPAVAEAIGAGVSVGLGLLFVGALRWGMVGAALAVVIPVVFASGLPVLLCACRALRVNAWAFLRRVVPGPVVAVLPFVMMLAVARWYGQGEPVRTLVLGLGGGSAVLAVIYWRWAFPAARGSGWSCAETGGDLRSTGGWGKEDSVKGQNGRGQAALAPEEVEPPETGFSRESQE